MKKLYLYDPRYNIKTETTYTKLQGMFNIDRNTLTTLKSTRKKIKKKYYIIDESITKKEINQLYDSEEFKDEIWKTIEGSDGLFLVSSYGRFKRINKTHPNGKFLHPFYCKNKRRNENTALIKTKFKGVYKEYPASRIVAYHFVDIYYENDLLGDSKPIKYKKYKFEDVAVFHKNGLVYDNHCSNLEFLDQTDIAKKVAHKARTKNEIVAIDIELDKEIGRFRTIKEAVEALPISSASVSRSINKFWGSDIVADKYIFKRVEFDM